LRKESVDRVLQLFIEELIGAGINPNPHHHLLRLMFVTFSKRFKQGLHDLLNHTIRVVELRFSPNFIHSAWISGDAKDHFPVAQCVTFLDQDVDYRPGIVPKDIVDSNC
jgi:hypothetical protein